MRKAGLAILAILACAAATARAEDAKQVTVRPAEYTQAFRNPLMGISPKNYTSRATYGAYQVLEGKHPWGTLSRVCIPWNWLEDSEKDGVERIRRVSDELFTGLEKHNIKAMPRVYLYWPGADAAVPDKKFYMRGTFWPSDLKTHDISSPEFVARLQRLIRNLGEVWDTDPRVGIIEMGIIGKWGEQTDPAITPEMEKILGDAFTEAFKRKKIMTRVRPTTNFDAYPFGLKWDSFAHQDQLDRDGKILAESQRWRLAPFGGETAYDWGNFKVQPGDSPTDSLADPVHRDFIVNLVRKLHYTQLGWIAEYDQSNEKASAGAAILQKALGYRFVLSEVTYPAAVQPGKTFGVSFTVRNEGAAPFYQDWPVMLCLLDPTTRKVVWQEKFSQVDVRKWFPGDEWDEKEGKYRKPAQAWTCEGTFTVPAEIARGEYVLGLAVLDADGGMVPALRFANVNYWRGGLHPIGRVGVGVAAPVEAALPENGFDDLAKDQTLHYVNPRQTAEQRAEYERREAIDPAGLLRPVHWWRFGTQGKDVEGSFSVRDVTQKDPGVTLTYDFSKAKPGTGALVTSDIHVLAEAKAIRFSVRSASPLKLTTGLQSSDRQRFEARFTYDRAGELQEFAIPLDSKKLISFGGGDKILRFPVVSLMIRVQNEAGTPATGEAFITRFRID